MIALAVDRQRRRSMFEIEWIVVADEAAARLGKKPRIPDVCRDPRYGVRCMKVLEMFQQEGWEF